MAPASCVRIPGRPLPLVSVQISNSRNLALQPPTRHPRSPLGDLLAMVRCVPSSFLLHPVLRLSVSLSFITDLAYARSAQYDSARACGCNPFHSTVRYCCSHALAFRLSGIHSTVPRSACIIIEWLSPCEMTLINRPCVFLSFPFNGAFSPFLKVNNSVRGWPQLGYHLPLYPFIPIPCAPHLILSSTSRTLY